MSDSALQLPEADSCAFCSYLAGTRPYAILWAEPRVAVLVTQEQRGIGHLLVLPTRHVPTLLDLVDSEAEDLMLAVRDAAVTIDRTYQRPGIAVWQNNGTAAHQAIPHLHFHVAGTMPTGGTNLGDVEELALEKTAAIAEQLTPNIPSRSGRRAGDPKSGQTESAAVKQHLNAKVPLELEHGV
ncbi:HIT family protein [Curtobacterium sp. MCPF17_003]|uniref:HIT family protein n=1 Tax=Curtobacterium sp. MCPF17_003 TaxID=2175637 RepID=UPI000D9D16A4|nr:HIT domain-containing protein [Curtobacterium sp. MCPF17_003]PYY64450.1 HIT family protein [Curtobacterium sp. MCPF17_003]